MCLFCYIHSFGCIDGHRNIHFSIYMLMFNNDSLDIGLQKKTVDGEIIT
jgi:hypothetical protein